MERDEQLYQEWLTYRAESAACGYEYLSFAEYSGMAELPDYEIDLDAVEDN